VAINQTKRPSTEEDTHTQCAEQYTKHVVKSPCMYILASADNKQCNYTRDDWHRSDLAQGPLIVVYHHTEYHRRNKPPSPSNRRLVCVCVCVDCGMAGHMRACCVGAKTD